MVGNHIRENESVYTTITTTNAPQVSLEERQSCRQRRSVLDLLGLSRRQRVDLGGIEGRVMIGIIRINPPLKRWHAERAGEVLFSRSEWAVW